MLPMLELYQFESCPFCVKVRSALTELELDVVLRQAPYGSANSDKIFEWTGRRTVPFLVDEENGVKMHESDDIVAYLKEYKAKTA